MIDGNAIIHRAYHALPKNMSTSRGELTNAAYGFTTTLIKVLEDLKPEHIVCSFDLAGKTFRHEAYSEYKATRVKSDQELYDQIPRVKEIVRAMNIPIYEKEGFEADDVIGTVVERLKNDKHIQIYVVSGDKDIYQLINGNVCVYSLRKGLSRLEIVDSEKIREEYNLDPHDFIDLKALAGDASDNIPGVPGIGPKTATDLIQKFDTLEKLYEKLQETRDNLQTNSKSEVSNNSAIEQFSNEMVEEIARVLEIKPRIVKLLLENKDQAFLSHKLATIHRDVPIDFNLADAKWGDYDKDKLKALFEELGFRSLLARFSASEARQGRESTEEQKKKDEQLRLL